MLLRARRVGTGFLFKQEAHARVRKLVDERSERSPAIPLLQAAFRELLGSPSVYGPDESGSLASFSSVSLPETLVGCPRLYNFVLESSRHYLVNVQSMVKSKVEVENIDLPSSAYWDPVLKRNRSKRLQLFARLLEIGLLRPRLKGAAKHFLGIFFVNKNGKKQKRLILDARIKSWSFVSPTSVNLWSSEATARIDVCLPEHVEEGSLAWHSAPESIEHTLGLGDFRDCFHRYVLDDEFASYCGVDTVSE